MFANFIYLIIAILVYAIYQPTENPGLSAAEAITLTAALVVGFGVATRWFFRRLSTMLDRMDTFSADHRYTRLVTRQSIVAIALFAVVVHGLGLPSHGAQAPLFQLLPTLLAVVFLLLFLCILSVVWHSAYPSYQKLYGSDLSRLAYVISNWRMAVPIILPWVMVSIVADIIFALPFERPKQFLSSTEGEVIYFLGFLMIVAVFAPLVIQRFWGCYPLEPGFYRQRIEKLCRRAGIGYRNIVYWPVFGGRMLTAGVMGIARRFRYILVTDALLRSLAPEEVDAVIAHEIGHVKKHHLLYYIFFMAGFMLISFAIYDVTIFLIFSARPLYQMVLNLGIDQATIISSLFSVVFLVIFLVYFRFVFGYFMRTFERQADGYVYSLFDTAGPMITTFQKIAATSGQSPDKPNWHHYSIRERIDYLLKCERNRHWIERHNRKVRYSLLAFSIVMAGIAVMGYQLNYGRAGNRISTHFFEEILNQEIAESPDNPELFSLLGDLKYSQNAFRETAEAYERSLALAPENPQVLNNLAWLYATSADETLRDSTRALALAQRAVHLDPSPHVLDTLAECHFVNGDIDAAIRFARRALDTAKEKHAYYREQLVRFQNAREGS
jgi:Zn-dependent protease with chaperone function